MQGAGRSVKRSFRDEEWVGRERFIKEVESVGLGEQSMCKLRKRESQGRHL